MANEVIVYELGMVAQNQGNSVSALTVPITTQFLDIASLSAQLNAKTELVRVQSKGAGFYLRIGTSSVSSVANVDGNMWLDAGQWVDIAIGVEDTHIDTAA